MRAWTSAVVVLFVVAFAAADGIAEEPAKQRVLIVTGSDVPAHDWRQTTPATRKHLESVEGLEVVVSEEPGVLESAALSTYDVVVLNYRNRPADKLSDAARKNLAGFVEGGKGLVALHFAVNAWPDWEEFRKMIGRVWIGRRKGGPSGHGPRGPFKVEIKNREHPITRGLEDFETDDELYSRLVGETPIDVLATARSEFSGKDEPMAWTVRYGKGRVFVLALGHDVKARETKGFRELLARGCRWAGGEG